MSSNGDEDCLGRLALFIHALSHRDPSLDSPQCLKCRDVEGLADLSPSAPYPACPSRCSAFAGMRRKSGKGGDLSSVELAKLWQFAKQVG